MRQARITRPTPTSALARLPERVEETPPRSRDELIDLFMRAITRAALRIDDAFPDNAPENQLRARLRDEYPTEATWECMTDTLANTQLDLDFPYPQAPKWDSAGGSKRIAPDGSPGVPPAWLAYFMREERRENLDAPWGTLVMALRALARNHHDLYLIYVESIGRNTSHLALARAFHVTPATISRRLTRARMILLAHLAFFTGDADEETRAHILRLAGVQNVKVSKRRKIQR
jgi:hypothetical protein